MFSKEVYEEIRIKTRDINKLKLSEDRLAETIKFKDQLYNKIADELDELFSNINLKKKKDE